VTYCEIFVYVTALSVTQVI